MFHYETGDFASKEEERAFRIRDAKSRGYFDSCVTGYLGRSRGQPGTRFDGMGRQTWAPCQAAFASGTSSAKEIWWFSGELWAKARDFAEWARAELLKAIGEKETMDQEASRAKENGNADGS